MGDDAAEIVSNIDNPLNKRRKLNCIIKRVKRMIQNLVQWDLVMRNVELNVLVCHYVQKDRVENIWA